MGYNYKARLKPSIPDLGKEPDRAAKSLEPRKVNKAARDPLSVVRKKGGKASSGFKTMQGKDPKRSKVAAAMGAPAAPVAPGTAPTSKEYNPFPFDYAKRDQTIDPATGMVKDQYKIDVMKERAESPWLKQKLTQQATQESIARDDANKNAAMNTANASSGLAQTSGVSAGAMERMQSASSRDALMAQQRVGQQGMAQRQDLSLQDTDRQQAAEQANIGTSLNQIDSKYGGDKDVWGQMATGYAANQMSEAIGKQKPTDSWQTAMDSRDRWKGFSGGDKFSTATAWNPYLAAGGQIYKGVGGK